MMNKSPSMNIDINYELLLPNVEQFLMSWINLINYRFFALSFYIKKGFTVLETIRHKINICDVSSRVVLVTTDEYLENCFEVSESSV